MTSSPSDVYRHLDAEVDQDTSSPSWVTFSCLVTDAPLMLTVTCPLEMSISSCRK